MSVGTTIKRAPKWAWYAAGGVAIGGIGLRLYKNRTASTADATTSADTAAADPGNYSYGAGGVNGVIVPPVIIPPADSTGDAAGLLGSVLGGVGDLTGLVLGSVETLIGPTQDSQQGLIDTFSQDLGTIALANAGGPPTASQNGAPVLATPVPAPAPSSPSIIPIITGQTPQATTWDCPSTYPHMGPNPGSCFKDVCLKTADGHGHGKGLWHVYRDGTWRQVSSSC